MTGFKWDPKAFELGGERFAALAGESGDYLQTMAHNVSSWDNMTGLASSASPYSLATSSRLVSSPVSVL